jgi:hypothetical protein
MRNPIDVRRDTSQTAIKIKDLRHRAGLVRPNGWSSKTIQGGIG